jgi:hypothetical protein
MLKYGVYDNSLYLGLFIYLSECLKGCWAWLGVSLQLLIGTCICVNLTAQKPQFLGLR